jgi:ABC-type transport system involved in Fe-S cluster assembly fused permease/ATPase subunit
MHIGELPAGADRIHVLELGRIVDTGTHAELQVAEAVRQP